MPQAREPDGAVHRAGIEEIESQPLGHGVRDTGFARPGRAVDRDDHPGDSTLRQANHPRMELRHAFPRRTRSHALSTKDTKFTKEAIRKKGAGRDPIALSAPADCCAIDFRQKSLNFVAQQSVSAKALGAPCACTPSSCPFVSFVDNPHVSCPSWLFHRFVDNSGVSFLTARLMLSIRSPAPSYSMPR